MSESESSPVTEASDQRQDPIAPPPAKPAKSGRGLSVFALLLSLAAIAGSGYIWFENQVNRVQQESRLSVGVSEIGTQVSRLGDHITRLQQDQADVVSDAELRNRLLEFQNSVESKIAELSIRQQAVADSVVKLGAELERGVDQFIVDEVSQLLRLANNSLLFGKDIDAAINALTLADTQLRGLKDPRYALVRTQINQELAALSRVTVPDTEALSARLYSLAQEIPSLPLLNEPEERGPAEVMPIEADEESTFRGELKKIWHDLVNSISIQRVDQPPKPLLVPEQRYFLNENIRLAVTKAELALLQSQPEMYRRNLRDAEQWLREYFDLSDPAVTAVVTQIGELAAEDVEFEVPDITGSYEALQNALGGQ